MVDIMKGLVQAPPLPTDGKTDPDWPKWVEPHASHIVQSGDHISLPLFPNHHINRVDNTVTVLVANPEEEAVATSERVKPEEPVAEYVEPYSEPAPVVEANPEVVEPVAVESIPAKPAK